MTDDLRAAPDDGDADFGPRLGGRLGATAEGVDGAGVTRAGVARRVADRQRASRHRRVLVGAAAALLLVGGGAALAWDGDGPTKVASGPDARPTTTTSEAATTTAGAPCDPGGVPATAPCPTVGQAPPPPPTTTTTTPEVTTTVEATTTSTTAAAVPEMTTTTTTPIPAKPAEVSSFVEGGTAFAVYVTSFPLGEDYQDSVEVWEDPGQGYQLQAHGYRGRSNPMACDQGSEAVFPPFTPDPRNPVWVVGAYFATLAEARSFAANYPHPSYGPVEIRTTCIAQPDPATGWTRGAYER